MEYQPPVDRRKGAAFFCVYTSKSFQVSGESWNDRFDGTPAHRVRFALADKYFGDAEVTDFDYHLVLVEKNILRLQVPVQDEFVVHVVQGEQDLHKEVKDGVFVQQGVTALLYVVSQGSTCDKPSTKNT